MIDRNDLNTKDDVARESIEIRKLELDDCKKIMEIDRTEAIEGIFVFTEGRLVLEKGHRGIANWTKEEKEQRIKRAEAEVDNPNVIMIGAFHNDLLVGYIRVALISLNHREGMWHLGQIVVSNRYRRRGIATRLMDLAKERVVEAGGETIYMMCTPAESAVRFYLSVGFEPFDVPEDEYWRSGWDGEDLYMEMKLRAGSGAV